MKWIVQTILVLAVLLQATFVKSQSFHSRWQYSWGGNDVDMLNVMIPAAGNRYFFAGTGASDVSCTKTSISYGGEDFVAMMFDDNGNKLWEQSYGGSGWDQVHDAIHVKSGGYILVGETMSGASGIKTSSNKGVLDVWAVRIDEDGKLLWEQSYGDIDIDIGKKVIETPDGGFLIAALSLSSIPGYNHGREDYQLLKIDAAGNLLWSKLYGGTGLEDINGFTESGDGNYFLGGTSDSPVEANKTAAPIGKSDVWLVKVDPKGNIIWDKTYGTTDDDYPGSLLLLSDGNTLLVESSPQTGRIRKIDKNGNQIWESSCSTPNSRSVFSTATEDPETGDIYVAGGSDADREGCKTSPLYGGFWFGDIWIAVFDSKGNKTDDLDYGGEDADIVNQLVFLNHELWVTSWSDSHLLGNKTTDNCGQTADGWIIRLSKKFYINARTPASLCVSQTQSQLYFTTVYDFNAGNVFTVQMSDDKGSFSHPFPIGSKASLKSDVIDITLPASLPAGSGYKLRVVSSLPADTTPVYSMELRSQPYINLGNDTLLCPAASFTVSAGPQQPNMVYNWNDQAKSNTHIISAPGTYWCTVYNGCDAKSDTIHVTGKDLPHFTIGKDTGFCSGNSLILQPSVQYPDGTYLWNDNSGLPALQVTKGGTYWLQMTNVCGSETDKVVVTEYSIPEVWQRKDTLLCAGNKGLAAKDGFAGYMWNTGAGSQTIETATSGLYWVRETDAHACVHTDSITITEIARLPADFLPADDSMCSYDKLTIASHMAYTNYLWSTGSHDNSIVVQHPGTYWLQVTDRNRCVGSDTLQVFPKDCLYGFYMPTAFTPNGDGLNDKYKPVIGGLLTLYRFTIYNRLGQAIFTTTDIGKGWDGTWKSNWLDAGVYLWTCDYQLAGAGIISRKGTVVLMR